MQVHAATKQKLRGIPTPNGWDIVEVASGSRPDKKYRVDITFGRCSCPAWVFGKVGSDGRKNPCKHLTTLGFVRLVELASQPAKGKNKQTVKEVEYDQCL